MTKKLRFLPFIAAMILCLTGLAFGQETTGRIEGTVTDPNGGVVPNVSVTVTGNDAGFTQTVQTDQNGFFRVVQVPPGSFKVTTSAPSGFSAVTQDNVMVSLGIATPVNLKLALAGATASVTVTANEVEAIDPTASKIQTNITQREIEQLPKGTNFTSALKVAPSTRNEPAAAGFQIDGASGSENTFILDGQEVTNFRTGSLNNNNNIPFEFVKEIQVKSNGFEAEYGGATGGVVNVVSRGGGNDWHGELGMQFEASRLFAGTRSIQFGDPDVLTYFTPRRDSFLNTFPTATLSGPIIKDKLWFFASGAPQFTNTKRNFVFDDGTGQSYRATTRQDYYFTRIDASPSDKIRLNGTWTYNPLVNHGALPTNSTLFASGTASGAPTVADQAALGGRQPAQNVTGSATFVFNSRVVANVRGGRSYLNEKLSSYGIPNETRFLCAVGGGAAFPGCHAANENINGITNNFFTDRDISIRKTFDADVSWLVDNLGGRHQFKFGYQRNQVSNDVDEGYLSTGVVVLVPGLTTTDANGNRFGNGIGGNIGYGYLQLFGTKGKAGSTNEALFAQDSWQIFNRLTLNLGIRTERENVPAFAANTAEIKFGFGDKIAPRLGFAYDVTGAGKFKIFASYGWFYDRFKYELPRGSFGGDKYTRTYFPLVGGQTNPFAYTPAYAQAHQVKLLDFRVPSNDPKDLRVDPDLKAQRQSEITVGSQYAFAQDMVLGVRFTHKQIDHAIEDIGYHLPVSVPGTTITAGSEAYFIGNPGEGICTRGGCGREDVAAIPKAERKYDALELTLDKRFGQNLSLNASYTFSRLFGNYPGLASSDEFIINGTARNSPNVNRLFDQPEVGYIVGGQPDNGRLPTDRPHSFKFFGAYDFNWKSLFGHEINGGGNSTQFSIFTTATSGTPVTTRIFLVDLDYIPLFGRGDLGRTPVYTQTDAAITHRYKFGNDGRYSIAFDLNVLNLFNEANVLGKYEGIQQIELGPGNFGIAGTPGDTSGRIAFDRAFFNGGITVAKIQALIASGDAPKDVRYNQPILFQGPRSVRFGFRFGF